MAARTGADRGILYVAVGEQWYIDECLSSAASAKAVHPDLPVALVTDARQARFPHVDYVLNVREQIHPLKQKVKHLSLSPFRRTLFLDTDTVLRRPVASLFDRLNDLDFLIAAAPRVDWQAQPPVFLDYEAQGAFNTGVFLFRRSPAVSAFVNRWFEAFRGQEESVIRPGSFCDQCYFNQIFETAARECGMTWGAIPARIYNARAFLENILERDGFLSEVAIFHGRASQPRLEQARPTEHRTR
ncbi:MAG TPA: putative nucleotide-diphospho-sugar transferase [Bryobacteraceae bacterium]|nr:putative nucleotide-diphospho-sugar transferase [Bryobacteraceae bacterium]